ncbi:toprim domain-containing protein [Gilvimarinus japonicus]|uniref:Toprim domain-containing protein n=1 Tax=Gilvimarinus japonicus TaxID=1796469 RepID=A0ABV7HRJ0_9GAMM
MQQPLDHALHQDVLAALENDAEFQFKSNTKYFQYGRCNVCNRKSLFISKANPYRIKCSHVSCGFDETVFSRYGYLFEDIAKKYPATPENPNASADAYMSNSRGFPLIKINGWFNQGSRPLPNSTNHAPTVRFQLWGNHYWERLINASDIREFLKVGKKKKAHFSYGIEFLGKGWQPPEQTLQEGDDVYIVEGIFHAIALSLTGKKVIAAFSCNNLPRQIIEEHKGRGITWHLGYDNDFKGAGNDAAIKYRDELRRMDETCEITQCPQGVDWDDVYKNGKLNESFYDDCLHRGRVFGAESIAERAYWLFLRHTFNYRIMEYKCRLYSVNIDSEFSDQINEAVADANDGDDLYQKDFKDAVATKAGREMFVRYVTHSSISNCHPEFVYSQVDKSSGEVGYHFNVKFPVSRPMQIVFTGSALESPGSFNKALLNQAPGATFDGSANQLKIIRDQWFDKGVMIVDCVPFIGYDKDSDIYVFPDFGYSKGQFLPMGRYGYITKGKTRVKTTLTSIPIKHSHSFNGDWINNYYTAFVENGLVVLAFFMGSLFAEQVRKELGFFPFLEFTGQAGAGKSLVLEFCWRLLGRKDHEGMNPSKSTFAARSRMFTQVANMPVSLMEGDSKDGRDAKRGAFDYSELKDLFNGRGVRATGAFNRGNDIIEPPFRGTIVISQNAEIDGDEATLTRIVHCHATTAHQSRANKPIAEWFRQADLEEVCGFLPHVLRKESQLLPRILEGYRANLEQFGQLEKVKHGRIIDSHALVASLVQSLPLVFPKLQPQAIESTVNLLARRAVIRQHRIEADHPTIQAFWEIYSNLTSQMKSTQSGLSEPRYPLNHSKRDGQIAINLQEFHQAMVDSNSERIDLKELRKILPASTRAKFIGNKNVKSAIKEGETRWCAVFELPNATNHTA